MNKFIFLLFFTSLSLFGFEKKMSSEGEVIIKNIPACLSVKSRNVSSSRIETINKELIDSNDKYKEFKITFLHTKRERNIKACINSYGDLKLFEKVNEIKKISYKNRKTYLKKKLIQDLKEEIRMSAEFAAQEGNIDEIEPLSPNDIKEEVISTDSYLPIERPTNFSDEEEFDKIEQEFKEKDIEDGSELSF